MTDYTFTYKRVIIPRIAGFPDGEVEIVVKTNDKEILDYFDFNVEKLCNKAVKDFKRWGDSVDKD